MKIKQEISEYLAKREELDKIINEKHKEMNKLDEKFQEEYGLATDSLVTLDRLAQFVEKIVEKKGEEEKNE